MQLLEEELESQPAGGSGSRLMAITRDEIHRLEGLVTEFLLYAKPPPLDLDTFSAVGLLQRCQAILEGETEALAGRLVIEDRSDGAQVDVDLGQMTQLLLNLIQNALAAAQEKGGAIEVHLRALRESETAILEVEDHGVGMTAEQVEQMFEVFYSTRKGGTGLGLAVVQRIARAHGATLEVISAPGSGTRVRVILPLSTASKSEETAAPVTARSASVAES
jgi:signal transduction histidine kinase